MTPQEKQQKIEALQHEKSVIYNGVVTALENMNKLEQAYQKSKEAYSDLKRKYEALDREEKLLTFSMKPKIPPKEPKNKTSNQEKVKKEALKALEKLDPTLRAELIANLIKDGK